MGVRVIRAGLGGLLVALACNAAQNEKRAALPAGGSAQTPAEEGNEGHATLLDLPPLPVRLEPSPDCVQPLPREQCADGYCRVEPGCFIMGAPRDEIGAGKHSNIQAQVRLTHPFLMGRTEVTRSAWLEAGWGPPRRNEPIGAGSCEEPECPVSNVSFFDAIQYANSRSQREGLAPCYQLAGCTGEVGLDFVCTEVLVTSPSPYECEGYRLPMEAEWEYAARAGTTTAFYGGEAVSTTLGECVPEPALDPIGWYCHNSGERAHPVAGKLPNAWGLHDLHGNLWEWCNDVRDTGAGYGEGPLVDPLGVLISARNLVPLSTDGSGLSAARVLRGGIYTASGDFSTAAKRGEGSSFRGSAAVGFRLVRTVRP